MIKPNYKVNIDNTKYDYRVRKTSVPSDHGFEIDAPDWFKKCKSGDVVYNTAGLPILLLEPVHDIVVPGTGSYIIHHGAKSLFSDGVIGNLLWYAGPVRFFQTLEESKRYLSQEIIR